MTSIMGTTIPTPMNTISIRILMTTTMNNMKVVVDLLEERGLRDRFKVIIGGKPCSKSFAKKIGADDYSSSAPGAVRLVKRLMAEKADATV